MEYFKLIYMVKKCLIDFYSKYINKNNTKKKLPIITNDKQNSNTQQIKIHSCKVRKIKINE